MLKPHPNLTRSTHGSSIPLSCGEGLAEISTQHSLGRGEALNQISTIH